MPETQPENTQRYRLTRGSHSRVEQRPDGSTFRMRYRAGGIFVPTNKELERLKDRLVPFQPQPAAADDQGPQGGGAPVEPTPYDGLKQAELADEVKRRVEAGRVLQPVSQKKDDLIAALVADDQGPQGG